MQHVIIFNKSQLTIILRTRIDEGWCLIRELETVSAPESRWPRLSYTESVTLLEDAHCRHPFIAGPPIWGDGLATEHERYIVAAVGDGLPVVVCDYPASCKPFYFRNNGDGRTVASMDILFPRLAELIGGGQREERLQELLAAMDSKGMHDGGEDYEWYVDLRRWGTAPHAGFGTPTACACRIRHLTQLLRVFQASDLIDWCSLWRWETTQSAVRCLVPKVL